MHFFLVHSDFTFAESTVITLSDWYQTPAPSLFPNTGNVDPYVFKRSICVSGTDRLSFSTPDSTLINGLGRYSGNPTSSLSVVNVTQGTRFVACCHEEVYYSHAIFFSTDIASALLALAVSLRKFS